jgi:hypothetical protein
MVSLKVVTPVKARVQGVYACLKILDSGFRRNDEKGHFQTFYETINFAFRQFGNGIIDIFDAWYLVLDGKVDIRKERSRPPA